MGYKRVVISEFGGPHVLRVVTESALPEPKAGEVRVRVLATSVCFTDTMIRKGMYPEVKQKPPFSPGYDMIGVVDKCGKGVNRFETGQRVADLPVIGAYAQYLCIPENRLVPVPEDLDPAEAAALVLSYVTAMQLLHRAAKVKPGERILVHGAGGAVGTAMLQMGKQLGLEMFATASRAKHDRIAAYGAVPIDYRDEDFLYRIKSETGGGVDAAFDPIGGDTLKKSWKSLRSGGRLIAFGFYNAVTGKGGNVLFDFFRLSLWNFLPNGRSTLFYSIGAWRKKHPDWFYEDLTALFDQLRDGRIAPVIDTRIPLLSAKLAHERIERKDVDGKIILMPHAQTENETNASFV